MNKEKLKERIGKLQRVMTVFESSGHSIMDNAVSLTSILSLIDQLDEPEKLSQEWIEKHRYHDGDLDAYFIRAESLENLIVDEPEKPIIPQFVADWISQAKKWGYSISNSMGHVPSYFDTTRSDKAMRWANKNQDIFARAWLYGYEIEKDSLYFITFPTPNRGNINMWRNTDTGSYYFAKSSNSISQDGYKCAFTEKEIKSIDPRYWPFAELIEASDDI